jgi:uncharacterized protein
MGTEQYHEPPDELPQEARTFARMCTSLIEEAEAINWYAQRLAIERDTAAAALMRDAQNEEFKHFSMDLEYLLRRTPRWRVVAERILFQSGDILEHGEAGEEAVDAGNEDEADPAVAPAPGSIAPASAPPATPASPGSLGIGSLRGRER